MVWDWDDELKDYVKEITKSVDCIVLGQKTCRRFILHWTAALNNSKGAEESAKKMVETPKIVFSKTLTNLNGTIQF